MKKLKEFLFVFSMLMIISVGFVSCNDNNDSVSGTSHMRVSLTDSPGDYEEVNIEVLDVKIKNSTDTGENGWVSIGNITPGIYNLLDLTGGVTQLLADNDIPSGHIAQIRLVLGTNNTVKIDGVSYPLDTPSAQQSGLKLSLNMTLVPNTAYNFVLDFDVDKSIVSAGNSGKYILHPTMRIFSEEVTGSIKGIVTPHDHQVLASVSIPGTGEAIATVVSTYADANGVFFLHGIPAGIWSVTLTPDADSGFSPKTINNVTVVNGQTTDTGTTTFP